MMRRLLIVLFILLPLFVLGQTTYTSLNGPYIGNVYDLVNTSSGVSIAATSNSIYRSTDGQNWTRTPAGTSTFVQDLEINSTSGLIYAISNQLIFTSSDNGLTWTQLTTTGLPGSTIKKIKIAPNGNVWVATGATLYRANASTPTVFNLVSTFSSTITDLEFGPSNQVYISTSSHGVKTSTNNGLTFLPTTTTSPTASVYSLAVNATGTLFALTDGGPYRSNDGINWTIIKNNLTDPFFTGFIETDISGNVYLFNNDTRKIYSVSSTGSAATPVVWSAGKDYPISISANAALFSSSSNWLVGFFNYAIASTADAGVSWTQSSTGIRATSGSISSPKLYRTSTNRILMGWSGMGYYVSIDDGASWDLINTGDLNRPLSGFITASDNSIIGYGLGIVRSTDNGQNWTLQSSSNSHSFLTNIGSTLYSNSFNTALLSSVDNGVTWTTVTMTGITGTPQKLIASGSSLYTFTTNTGAGVYRINPTTGAATLVFSPPSGFIRDFQVIGNTILALGNSTTLYVSSDNGATWVNKTISSSSRIWAFDDQNFFMAASFAGSFYSSIDGGNSWVTNSLGDATGFVTDALFTPQGVAYLIGTNMVVNKSTNVVVGPKAPTNLISLGKTVGGNIIQWNDNSTVETGYELEESIGGTNTSYQLTGTLSAVSNVQNKSYVQLTAIDPVVPEFVRVRAVNAAGTSAYTNELSITSMNVSCVRSEADLIPDNRSWTATTTVDPGFSAVFGCTANVCPSDLGGTYSYSTTVTAVGAGGVLPTGPLTGTGTMTEQTEGVYAMTDFSFGVFAASYGDSPALGSLRFKDACNCVSYTGSDQYGDTYTITIVSVSSTVLKFDWTTTYGDKGTTTLTRTDAKTWPALTSPNGAGPAVDTQINIIKNSTNNYTVSSYGGGLIISGRTAPTGAATFIESCGETIFLNSNNSSDIPNGNGTWNSTTKTLVLKWQSSVNNVPFKGTTTYVLNPTDPIPGVPSLRAYIYSNTEAFLNWSASTFASSYDIERSTTSGSGFSVVATVNFPAVSYIDKNLTSGTQYFYRIKAKNASGSSAASSEAAVTPGSSLFRPVENSISLNFENQQGVSWGDLDGDGDEDLALPSFINNAGQNVPPVFYENIGNGQFNRRDLAALADENTAISRAIALIDMDNDNDLDMFISRSGNLACLLLVNNGSWNFTKKVITESAFETFSSFRALGVIDYDKDGRADIFLGNDQGGITPLTFSNYVLKNNNGNTFTKNLAGDFGTDLNSTVTLVSADYDNDGDQDIFAVNRTNATSANRLYKNNGDGTFTKVTGLVFDTDLMSLARTASWGDINNDGNLDLYVGITQAAQPDRLYLNSGPPNYTFTNQSSSVVAETGTSTYGSAFGDIDNDGDIDLIVVNSGANSIFINSGTGTFTKSATQELLVNPNIFEIGGSFADFDKDGFLDFYPAKGATGLVDFPNLLYKNTLSASSTRNWIQVKLIGTTSNASAIGARVKIVTTLPNRSQIREVTAMTGYGSQNSLIQHFGLGAAATVATIEIRWPSGLIQTLTNVPANQIITVTEDGVGPSLTFSPAHNAINVPSSSSIQLTVNEPATKVAGKMLKVYLTSDLANPVYSIDVNSATATGNTFTFVLPQKLQLNTSYSVSVDAGMFQDVWLNPSLSVSATNWQFTTSPGPQVTLLNPAHLATNVAENAIIEITFDVPVTGVSGKKIKVVDEANTSSVFLNADATAGTVSGNKVSFTPTAVFPFLKTFLVIVDPGAFVDASQNDFPGISSGNWKFTVKEAPDLTPPGVSFTAPSTLNKGFNSTKFELTAADNKSIASAIMFYRKVTATNFIQLTGVLNAANKYEFSVEETFFDDTGMEYYFEVKDPSENKTRSPVTGNHLTRLRYSDSNVGIGVTAGSNLSGYQIIAVPFEEMVSQQISVLFEEFGSPDATKWRMLRYKNNPQAWEEYPNPLTTVKRGEGYFVISKSGVTLKLGDVNAPSNTQSNLFSLSLNAGWNLIGNPYTSVINWSDSKVTGVGDLKIFSGGAYANGDQLNVFQGGFVFADAATNVSVKLKTSPSGGRVSGSDISADLGNSNWILPIKLEQMGERFLLGGVGMSEASRISYDDMDDLAPPSLTSKLEMKFEHPEHFMKYFARDVVPSNSEYVWSFKVEAENTGYAELKWDNTSLGNNSKELFLMDVKRQIVIDMRAEQTYKFDPRISAEFKVYFGENLKEKVKPEGIFLGDAFPNPAKDKVTIPFTVSGAKSEYQVKLELLDAMGRKVATLVDRTMAPGFYNVVWDVSESGSQPANGMLICRLMVAGEGNSESHTSKILINK